MNIRKRLWLLILVTTLIYLVSQLYYCISIYTTRTDDIRQASFLTIRQTADALEDTLSQAVLVGKTMAESEEVQRYLLYKADRSSEDTGVQIRRASTLRIFMNGMVKSNSIVSDIVLVDLKEGILSYSGTFSYANYYRIWHHYPEDAFQSPFFSSWTELDWNESAPLYLFSYILPVRYTSGKFQDRSQILGYCIITCRKDALDDVVNKTMVTAESMVAVTDATGIPIAQNAFALDKVSQENTGEWAEKYDQLASENENDIVSMRIGNEPYFTRVQKSESSGWYSMNLVPVSEMFLDIRNTIVLGIALAVISVAIAVVIGGINARSISQQMESITDALKEVGENRGKKRLDETMEGEFGVISQSVNQMLDDVERANEQVAMMQSELYEKELLQKETELKALQSQINPHFLYNTLECIRSLAAIHGIREISTLTTSMASIFRYSISSRIESTVREECACVQDYYKILSIRYGGRLEMMLDAEEGIQEMRMIKMSLQPLVENSVKHGFEATEKDIHIEVKCQKKQGNLVFTVKDDGAGMTPERLEETRKLLNADSTGETVSSSGGNIGLANIAGRIRLCYGSDYGVQIESEQGKGTTVMMTLPGA